MSAIEIQEGERNLARIVQSLISVLRKWNATGQLTLRAGFTTTVVTKSVSPGAVNVAVGDEVMLSPRTANAAAAVGTTFISAVGQGTFTITHLSAVSVDRTFGWGVR